MQRLILPILAMLLLGACCTQKKAVELPEQVPHVVSDGYSATTLIISYDKEVGKQPLLEAVEAYGAELIYDYKLIPSIAIRKPDGKTLEQTIAHFRQVKGVLRVEKDRINQLH